MSSGVLPLLVSRLLAKEMALGKGLKTVIVTIVVLVACFANGDDTYTLDDSPGLGRMFDGIGGLSGGGVSNKIVLLATLSYCSSMNIIETAIFFLAYSVASHVAHFP